MEDRSPQILGVAILFFVLSIVSVGLRIYVRICMMKAFGIDDALMVATLFFFLSYLICQMGGIAHGTGKHRSQLTDANAQIALAFWFFCELFYTFSTALLKVSVGLFLLRITVKPLHIWIIRIIMAASVICGLVYNGIVTFQCHPVSYWWDLNPDHHGKCISPLFMAYTTYVISALNALADWVFGTLPIFIVKDLQMKRTSKIIVATILGFAALGSAATIVRFPYVWTLTRYKGDFLWRTSNVAIWTTVEVGVGIIAGCAATLKPLMKPFLQIFGIHSTRTPSTGTPWSTKRVKASKPGFSSSQPLDTLRPKTDDNVTTTTVMGKGPSKSTGLTSWADRNRRESEESIIPYPANNEINLLDPHSWKDGISKSVQITTTEERSASQHGQSSISGTDTDEEQSASYPARIYERF